MARCLVQKDVSTAMIYTHVLNKGGHGVRSPEDGLQTGLYSLYKPSPVLRAIAWKGMVFSHLDRNMRRDVNFLYRKRQSVFAVLYRLYNYYSAGWSR